MSNPLDFRANGKLLLAGEYLVLDGACALALPLRFGQSLQVDQTAGDEIIWRSVEPSGPWFDAVFQSGTLEIKSALHHQTAEILQSWIHAAREIEPDFLGPGRGYSVTVTADYPLVWGWGSSSSLISLLAQWSGADPFELYRKVSKGSGADLACARAGQLLFYQLLDGHPMILPTHAGTALKENTWFAYLGNSRSSAEEINAYRSAEISPGDISEISDLSVSICRATEGDELIRLADRHETIIGRVLKREPLGKRFPSFPGTVKSLGAWGGDYAMFISREDAVEVQKQLVSLGFTTIFRYHEIALQP